MHVLGYRARASHYTKDYKLQPSVNCQSRRTFQTHGLEPASGAQAWFCIEGLESVLFGCWRFGVMPMTKRNTAVWPALRSQLRKVASDMAEEITVQSL